MDLYQQVKVPGGWPGARWLARCQVVGQVPGSRPGSKCQGLASCQELVYSSLLPEFGQIFINVNFLGFRYAFSTIKIICVI